MLTIFITSLLLFLIGAGVIQEIVKNLKPFEDVPVVSVETKDENKNYIEEGGGTNISQAGTDQNNSKNEKININDLDYTITSFKYNPSG